MRKLLYRVAVEEEGTELLEYALLIGLIVVGALGLMGALGVKIVRRWENLVEDL